MSNVQQHRVFISYHHDNDQMYKDALCRLNDRNDIFVDYSVDTGDINDKLPPESIREKIRDEYLRDSTVTIVLVGSETYKRKYVDWEIYSSMYNGTKNKKSGIIVVLLPGSTKKPVRIEDNLRWVSIVHWSEIACNPNHLRELIELSHKNKDHREYDLSREMMKKDLP